MRSATAGELTVLASAAFAVFPRILVLDTEATWQDLTTYKGVDWAVGYDIDGDIDQPVAQGNFLIRRDSDNATPLSLSPLRTDSLANRKADGTTFQSIVDIGRNIRFELACIAYGTTPVSGDWKRLFEGVIDVVDPSQDPMPVVARDLGASIVDQWTPGAQQYDYTASPQPIETVIQTVLNYAYGGSGPTLYTPTSPSFNIKTFAFDIESTMDVLLRLIGIIGWDLRYKWDAGTSSFRFTLSNPLRFKTTPDATIGTDQYVDVTNLRIDRTNVRNRITVKGGTGAGAFVGFSEDTASQTKYGLRAITIVEGSDSPINTNTEAQSMSDAMLADLKDPKADHAVSMFPYWPVELNDLLRFPPNAVHYNVNQDLAAVRIRHRGSVGSDGSADHTTEIDTRGKPASANQVWLDRGRQPEPPAHFPVGAQPLAFSVRTDGSVDMTLVGSADTLSWRYAWSTSALPSNATALAGTVVNSQQATVNIAAGLGSGDILYVKAYPFSLPNGNGMAGQVSIGGITGGRAFAGFDSAGRLYDQRHQNQVAVGSINSVQTSRPLSATNSADPVNDVVITIAAHSVRYGFGTVSYNSGSITGLTAHTLTTYFVYADDPTFAGGAVTYVATTNSEDVVANNGRYYVGKINSPAPGGSGNQLGGGAGSQTLH